MNKEEFVTYEQAEALKAAGFDYDTRDCYLETYRGKGYFRKDKPYNNFLKDGHCACPTLSQVAKWLREKKALHIVIVCSDIDKWGYVAHLYGNLNRIAYSDYVFPNYEAALSDGINKCLDFLNN